MPHKTNPRRRPATMADVERAKKQATRKAIRVMLAVFLYVLRDKFGWQDASLMKAAKHIDSNVQMILDGSISLADIEGVLGEDYQTYIRVKEG